MVESSVYTIRVKGHLHPCWAEWFDGMEIIHLPNGETKLIGTVMDQASLYGLLLKVRDLGLALLAVECGEPGSLSTV